MTGGPNVVVAVMDTTRAEETVPATGLTPTLSRLASEGTEFTNAFSTAPWTLPSHASLFTGTYPSRHGAHGGHTYLDAEFETLAETFSNAGYETVGFSNNTWITAEFGFDRGFETLRKGWQLTENGADFGDVIRQKTLTGKARAVRRELFSGNPVRNALNAAYAQYTHRYGDDGAKRTVKRFGNWLDSRTDDRSFFAFVNCIEPHIDYRPPREYVEERLPEGTSYEEALAVRQDPRAFDVEEYDLTEREFRILRALYRGEIAYLDDRIGEIRESLEAAGEWEDTVFVLTSDHGENIGEHGLFGHQYNLYETTIHVPLVVAGGAFDGGGRREELVQLVDLPPTLADETGIDAPYEQYQGRSVHPERDVGPRTEVVAEYVAPQPDRATLEARFESVPEKGMFDRSLRAIRTHERKLVRGSDGLLELYDLHEDPAERLNLADDERGLARDLGDALDAWADSFEHAASDGSVEMGEATERRLRELGYL